MKFKHAFMMVAAAVAVLAVSCKKPKNPEPEPEPTPVVEADIEILTSDIPAFSDEGGTLNVKFSSNSNWSLEIEDGNGWLTANTTSGAAGEECSVTFTCQKNESYDERIAVVTIYCANENSEDNEDILIIQKPKGALILTTDKTINVGYEGAVIAVRINANASITATIQENCDWIVPGGIKALQESVLEFSVYSNPNTEARSASITFSNEFASETVTVNQDAKPEEQPSEVSISSADELIAFAQAYNAKEFDGIEGLKAKLTADIAFDATSSEAFNATGGIGLKIVAGDEEDYYFNGSFDGDGHAIKGLAATVPLFKATGESGEVKNLTIDNTSSFTFTHKNASEAQFGAIVGYHKGVLDNVKVAANITLAAVADVTNLTQLGGLAGRTTIGKLQNGCEYSGVISTPDGFNTTAKLIIGGLVGRFSNAGSVDGCFFKGAISNAARVLSTESSTPYLLIGGVVGQLDGGATVSSTNSTADHAEEATAYSTLNGILVNKSVVAYNSVVGGIAGEVNNGTISNCTNAATIACTVFKEGGSGATGNANGRYMKSGGIAGKVNADGVITGCTNNGTVQHRSNPRLQDLAGIAGYNAGKISSCTNKAAVNHMTTGISGATNKGGRIVNIAGVIGENAEGAVVTDVHNTANLQVSAMENNYDTEGDKPICEARMGGVIAYNLADIDGGASKSITNTGQVYFNSNFSYQFIGYELGGIVGYSKGAVRNAKNSGYVLMNWNSDANVASKMYLGGIVGQMGGNSPIEGCINQGGNGNAGEVYLNVKAGAAEHTDIYAGGILGHTTSNVSINECVNSGYVHGGNSTAHNGKTCFTGGIVAYLAGASSINKCDNSGVVYNNQRNNTDDNVGSTYNGGIAGYVLGTADGHILIQNCNNTASDMFSRRGWVGGVVGYSEYADFVGCSFSKDVTRTCLCRGIGGIVGWGVNTTLSSCSFTGTELSATQIQTNRAGGIAGKLDGCTVDGCNSYVETMMAEPSTGNPVNVDGGAIVGISGEGNTIKNCHYKATINGAAANIAGTGSFTDGGGNAADL